jgi:hypothetical protein
MTKKELVDRIDQLEKERWLLSMKDRWNGRDYSRDDKLLRDIERAREQLKRMDS